MIQATTLETVPQVLNILMDKILELSQEIRNISNKSHQDQKTIMYLEDTAELIGKSTSTLYKLASAGKIPAYKRGKKWYFVKEEVLNWLLSMPRHSIYANNNGSSTEVRISKVEELIRPKRGRKPQRIEL